MLVNFQCDRRSVGINVPDNAIVYESHFPTPDRPAAELALEAAAHPYAAATLAEALRKRRGGDVVIVVSDFTRPVPYASYLGHVLGVIESAGVVREQILILIATGMHRRSTADERRQILGPEIAGAYRVEDHDAVAEDLVELPGKTWSGNVVRLNRRFMQAGFRMTCGLVEPHFMAGFSGGRKSICPGLVDLATIRQFHGYGFMANPLACNGLLKDNPCQLEALSIARQAGVDFVLDVVLNKSRQVVRAFAGDMERAHAAACDFAAACACQRVERPADVAITSSGGYPLDATFYQCVKGFVSCLPAVKTGGRIIAFGGCREGVGSPEYTRTMLEYSGRWRQFFSDIAPGHKFTKDQWQLQMHCRALAKVGQENLHFVTDGLTPETLAKLSVTAHAAGNDEMEGRLQALVDQLAAGGATLAVFPEGPYCAPVG